MTRMQMSREHGSRIDIQGISSRPCDLASVFSVVERNLIDVTFRCSCDVPAHAYTFSWEGNPNWSKAYVGSEELFEYFKGRAKAYGIDKFVHLQHRVVGCTWDEKLGQWNVDIQDEANNRSFTDTAEVVINACGFLK